MSRTDRRLQRYIDAIVRDRRPRRGDAGDDHEAMRLAARLHAAHPGSADPSPEFIDDLARRLRNSTTETQPQQQPALPQRRQFLFAAGAAAAAGIGAGFGIERVREAITGSTSSTSPQAAITPDDGAWVAVARVADMKLGAVKRFSANGIEGFVLNANGKISALSAVCTDQGCILTADKAGSQLKCPCHYAAFDLNGMPRQGSYHKVTPLPVIQVRTNGEDIEALLPNWA